MLAALLLVLAANPALDDARALYDQFKFKEALRKLDWASSRLQADDRVDFEVLSGLCRFNLNQVDAAKAHFKRALELDAKVELPRGTTPKAREVFSALKAEREKVLAALPKPAPVESKPADTPKVVVLEPQSAPVAAVVTAPSRSYVPPVASLVLGVAALGTGIAMMVVSNQTMVDARRADFEDDAFKGLQSARAQAVTGYAAFGVAGLAAVITVLLFALGG